MTNNTELIERLRQYNGAVECRVQHPETGTYCISFDWHNTFNPKRAAEEWHADHKKRFPESEYSTTYIVQEIRDMSQQDDVCKEAANELEAADKRITELEDVLKMARGHVLELCRAFNVPLPEASLTRINEVIGE